METQNPVCAAYCGSWKFGPIDGLGSKISVGCGGRNAIAVHPSTAFFSGTALIRFRSNLVRRCKFPFQRWKFAKKSKFCKFKMVDGRHIESRFLAVSQRHIGW